MLMTRLWLKLAAAAAILVSSLLTAPSAQASRCTDDCHYQHYLCLNVWQYSQRDCDLDRYHCLIRCP